MTHLNQLLETLKTELPGICTDKELIEQLPKIFKNPCNLNRMRARGQTPPYFSIDPHIYYLRDDVLCWLQERYQNEKNAASQTEQKKPSKHVKKKYCEATKK